MPTYTPDPTAANIGQRLLAEYGWVVDHPVLDILAHRRRRYTQAVELRYMTPPDADTNLNRALDDARIDTHAELEQAIKFVAQTIAMVTVGSPSGYGSHPANVLRQLLRDAIPMPPAPDDRDFDDRQSDAPFTVYDEPAYADIKELAETDPEAARRLP